VTIKHSCGFEYLVHFIAQAFADAVPEEVEVCSSGEDLDVSVRSAFTDRFGLGRPAGQFFQFIAQEDDGFVEVEIVLVADDDSQAF